LADDSSAVKNADRDAARPRRPRPPYESRIRLDATGMKTLEQ